MLLRMEAVGLIVWVAGSFIEELEEPQGSIKLKKNEKKDFTT